MTTLKTFSDLEFVSREKHHGNHKPDMCATMDFPNGWGVSVVTSTGNGGMGSVYGCLDEDTYELAVLCPTGLHYKNPVARGDVVPWISSKEVDEAMGAIQDFPQFDEHSLPAGWSKFSRFYCMEG